MCYYGGFTTEINVIGPARFYSVLIQGIRYMTLTFCVQSQKGEVFRRSLTDVCPYAELFTYFISFGCLFASYPVNLPLFNSVTVTTFKAKCILRSTASTWLLLLAG